MSQVAYAQRDLSAIRRRAAIHFVYRVWRKVLGKLSSSGKTTCRHVSTYPAITTRSQLAEVANKIAWAFPKKAGLRVDILVTEKLKNLSVSAMDVDENMRNYLHGENEHIHLVTEQSQSDMVLFIDAKALLRFNPLMWHKTDMLDKHYFSDAEGNLLQYGFSKTLSKVEFSRYEKLSQQNFGQFMHLNRDKKKAYCFVTGPSFDLYDRFEYEEDALKVICNSTVKNDAFLSYIGAPDLLVFADPVFHFSPSEYSAAFRDEVVKVYEKYKPYIAVPLRSMALLLAHYPFLEDRLIGMEIWRGEFHFPSREALWLRGSKNILTQFMLPMASAVSEEVCIIGADGRKPDEKYFWKHSKSAQFDDLMQTVFETHPSFFRDRDYKDYYEEHCAFLEKLIRYGEERGKHYFSLTPSYIPALKERMK